MINIARSHKPQQHLQTAGRIANGQSTEERMAPYIVLWRKAAGHGLKSIVDGKRGLKSTLPKANASRGIPLALPIVLPLLAVGVACVDVAIALRIERKLCGNKTVPTV